MSIAISYRATNRDAYNRFSPLFDDVTGFTSPLSISAAAIDSTTVRITFSREVPNNEALRCASTYHIARSDNDAPLVVHSVTPSSSVDPISVDVEVDEQQDAIEYTASIDVIGEPLPLSDTFVGIGVAPEVVSAFAETTRRVRVVFSEPMDAASGIADSASYTITADVGSAARTVVSVSLEPAVSPTYVLLVLDGDLTVGTDNYNVAVDTTVTDAAGNELDAAADDADFDGTHADPLTDHCEEAKARLAYQHRGQERIEDLICVFAERMQAPDQALIDTRSFRSIDTAFGEQLDRIGAIIGITRKGLDDEEYRIRLRAKAQVIRSRGRPDELLNILTTLDDGFTASEGGNITLVESFPATVILNGTLVPSGDVERGAEFAQSYLRPAKPAGVRLIHEFWETDIPLLLMREIGDPQVPLANAMSELPNTLRGHMKEAW
jgi:hypothetical protein